MVSVGQEFKQDIARMSWFYSVRLEPSFIWAGTVRRLLYSKACRLLLVVSWISNSLFECLFVVLFSLLGLLITLRLFLEKISEERKKKKRIEKGRRIGEGKEEAMWNLSLFHGKMQEEVLSSLNLYAIYKAYSLMLLVIVEICAHFAHWVLESSHPFTRFFDSFLVHLYDSFLVNCCFYF